LERIRDFARRYPPAGEETVCFAQSQSAPPSLQLKKLTEHGGQELWSARVTLKYRALAVKVDDEYVWFWIGEHDIYDDMI
jgi:hypothetical protein